MGILECINFMENLPLLLNRTVISKFQNIRRGKPHQSTRATFTLRGKQKGKEGGKEFNNMLHVWFTRVSQQ